MKAKPVQIAIIVIGLLVGIVGIVLSMKKYAGPDLANKMILVDVTSGELYAVSTNGRSILLPYRSPDSNEPTLLPVIFDENDSSWRVKSRYMDAMNDIKPVSDKIDPKSGRLNVESGVKPKVIK